jgi:hypothetical protein
VDAIVCLAALTFGALTGGAWARGRRRALDPVACCSCQSWFMWGAAHAAKKWRGLDFSEARAMIRNCCRGLHDH